MYSFSPSFYFGACVRKNASVTAGVFPARRRISTKMNSPTLAHSVPEACSITRTGRTSLYEAIRSGALRAVKRGRRTLILNDDLRQWVQSLPPAAVKPINQLGDEESFNV